jgi:hypothetical protein
MHDNTSIDKISICIGPHSGDACVISIPARPTPHEPLFLRYLRRKYVDRDPFYEFAHRNDRSDYII